MRRIIDALGTLTEDIEAIVAVTVIVQRSPKSKLIPFNRAMKYVPIAMNIADAFVLM